MGIRLIVFALVLAVAAISPTVVLANSAPKVRLYNVYEITATGPTLSRSIGWGTFTSAGGAPATPQSRRA